MKVTDRSELMVQALNVMNKALRENKDQFPYKQIYDLGQALVDGMNIGVIVYADDPDTPHDYFTIRWEGDQLDLVSHGKEEPKMAWKVPESYLNDVVENADAYIANPTKLDWEWLKQRLNSAVDMSNTS